MSRQDGTAGNGRISPIAFHTLLALQAGPRHGYAIMKEVEATSGSAVGPGAIYGAIQRLDEAGLIQEGRRLEPERGSRQRQEYEITDAGHAALVSEARRLAQLTRLVAERKLLPEGEA